MTDLRPDQIVESCLAHSKSAHAIVHVVNQSVANLRWARNTLTTNGETSQLGVTVIAFAGDAEAPRVAATTRATSDPATLRELVAAADAAAMAAEPATDAAPLVAGTVTGDFTELPATTSGGAFAGIVGPLGEMFAAASSDGREHFGYGEHHVATTYLGASTGLRLRHVQPQGRLELTMKSHDRSRSAWRGLAGEDFADVDLASADADLVRALGWQGRQVAVPAGRHDALLSPSAVSDLMIDLYWSMAGRDAAEGHSAFSAPAGTMIGSIIAPTDLHLTSDPADPHQPCGPFLVTTASSDRTSVFDNGIALEPTRWIDHGQLTSLMTTRAVAARFGLAMRPPIDNLRLEIESGTGDLDAIIARTDRALLVNSLWYQRTVDPQTLLVTGLTRDGVYLVEGGEVVGAVTNFRYNDSPLSLLSRITDATATTRTLARELGDYFNRAAMPALRVADFNFSTVSQAS